MKPLPIALFSMLVLVVLLVSGCRRQTPASSTTQPDETIEPVSASPTGSEVVVSQDALDDPNAPICLPKSNVVGNWVKHVAVRVAIPGELDELLGDQAASLEYFRLKRGASCVYRDEQGQLAYVELLETYTPEDAFGVLSVQCTSSEILPVGQLTRVDTAMGYHLHCWKGNYYVHVYSFVTGDPALRSALADLLAKIVFEMPTGSLPAWVRALPNELRMPGQQWLVRSARSLTLPAAAEVPVADPALIDRLLGLDKDTAVLVTAYAQPGLAGPNYVWVVRYPTANDARQAYRRYARAVEDAAPDSQLGDTLLLAPHNVMLVGTWTAQRESLMHVLPRIRAALSR